jgi:hypothetical protein
VDEINHADEDSTSSVSRENSGARRGRPVNRRRMLISGTRALAGAAVARVMAAPGADERVIPEFRAAFERVRRAGLRMSPVRVLPSVAGHFTALCGYAGIAGGRYRSDLLVLASRFAEYAGWMSQEAGDEAGTTVELARRVQHDPAGSRRVLGLAARCEAQDHALRGDHNAFRRALDRAATLLDAAAREPVTGPAIGSTHPLDPISLVTGWSLHELGHPAGAAAILDREVPKIRSAARRPHTRFTIRIDLRQLGHTLGRWRAHPLVRELYPGLTAVSYRSTERNR